jgi:dipeptidyl aminopeptidase/acylaminoacyl peptidase
LNSSEFFAFGTSVGGELVSLAALTGGHSMFDIGAYLNESSSVTAVADMFGPANLTTCGCFTDPQNVFGSDPSNLVLASPSHYVAPGAPPILIIHGVDDECPSPNPCVPVSQSIQFHNQLTAAGDRTQLVLVQNMGHMFVQVGSEPINPSLEQIAQEIVGFFDQYRSGQ